MFKPEDENALILFNINKSRFTVMSEVFGGLKLKHLNIIVDSNKVFEGFRQSFTKGCADTVYNEKLDHNLAAEFFNWIGHYRRYFKSLNIDTSFFLIHGNDDIYSEDLLPEWNSTYKTKASKFINFTIEKRIRTMAQYLPEIFIINSNAVSKPFDRSAIPLILQEQGYLGKSNTLYLTNDIHMMQLITILPKSHILRVSSKSANFIGKSKVFEYLSKDYKESIDGIPDDFLSGYFALIGGNGIEPIDKRLKKAMVLKGLKTLGTSYAQLDAEILYNLFSEKISLSMEDAIDLISRRLTAFDHLKRFEGINEGLKDEIEAQIQTYPDHDVASDFSNKWFGNSIDVNILF